MTPSDWERIRQDTERAIEYMKVVIAWAEIGKKKPKSADDKTGSKLGIDKSK